MNMASSRFMLQSAGCFYRSSTRITGRLSVRFQFNRVGSFLTRSHLAGTLKPFVTLRKPMLMPDRQNGRKTGRRFFGMLLGSLLGGLAFWVGCLGGAPLGAEPLPVETMSV